jgi:hypothetical protein
MPQAKQQVDITDGPWQVTDTAEGELWVNVEEADEHGFIGARVWADVSELRKHAQANARAIAAVPDMVYALQSIVANLSNKVDNPQARWDSALQYAKEALAKAGQTL